MTLKEIAKELNLSVATISRVINNSDAVKPNTRKKVIAFLEQNKHSYKYIAPIPNKTLALIIPDIHNPFYGEIIRGVTRTAQDYSYDTLLFDTQDNVYDEITYIEKAIAQKVEGIILLSSSRSDKEKKLKEVITNSNVPIILIDKEITGITIDGVFLDDTTGMVLLTETLLSNNHKSIVLLTGEKDSSVTKKRVAAFQYALNEFNVPFSNEQIIYASYTNTEIASPIIISLLKQKNRPTAFITCNGLLTMTAIKCLHENNYSIGKDIALVSFDEVNILKMLGINITSAYVDLNEMGKTGFELLLKKIEDPTSSRQKLIIVPSIIKRNSECFSQNSR